MVKVSGSRPSSCHRVVSLDKKLYPTLSLSTQVYKWVPGTYCWGQPCDGLASHPGGVAKLSVASCYRSRVKLQPCGRSWLVVKIGPTKKKKFALVRPPSPPPFSLAGALIVEAKLGKLFFFQYKVIFLLIIAFLSDHHLNTLPGHYVVALGCAEQRFL